METQGPACSSRTPLRAPIAPFVKRESRAFCGVKIEIAEIAGPGTYMSSLLSPSPRLIVALEERGGRLTTTLANAQRLGRRAAVSGLLTYLPPMTNAWEHADSFQRIRRVAIDFESSEQISVQNSALDWTQPRLMFRHPHAWSFADLLAQSIMSDDPRRESQVAHLAEALRHCLQWQIRSNHDKAYACLGDAELRRATEAMRRNEVVQVRDLAQCTGRSFASYSRAFKRSMGVSPKRWQMTDKVRRAKLLMQDTDMPLAEVALACGFVDQSHFSNVFRKISGSSPGAWRHLSAGERASNAVSASAGAHATDLNPRIEHRTRERTTS